MGRILCDAHSDRRFVDDLLVSPSTSTLTLLSIQDRGKLRPLDAVNLWAVNSQAGKSVE